MSNTLDMTIRPSTKRQSPLDMTIRPMSKRQDIIETYHREVRKFHAASQIFDPIRKAFEFGEVTNAEFCEARDEYRYALKRYEDAQQAVQEGEAEPIATARPVMLTNDQIVLLKACTIAQQEMIHEFGAIPNMVPASAPKQIEDCKELHYILTEAQ